MLQAHIIVSRVKRQYYNNSKRSAMEIKILLSLIVVVLYCVYGGHSAVFTVQNNCGFTVWPAILTGRGAAVLSGFELAPRASRSVNVPAPWSGRVWGRYLCSNSGIFSCQSGDCNSGQIECKGAGAVPPASLAEFTLGGADGKDFYDISLVDGFNLPLSAWPDRGGCAATSCPADINRRCPNDLAVRGSSGVIGCRSACDVFKDPRYCCTGAYNSPAACKPTNYSQVFKSQCPQAYSYAYDDQTSTFTCPTGGNYAIVFCP